MSSSIAIVPLLIVALTLIGLIVGITLWVTGGRSKGSGEMSCGACGYAVRGLEALNCPECGADLRVVGINRPKGGTARGIGIALTAVTALFILGCIGSMFLWVSSSGPSSPAAPSTIGPSVPPPVIPDPDPLDAGEIDQGSPDDPSPAESPDSEDVTP